MNFYKRFIGDYQRDTGHLSLAEHGAYALMLDIHYATEKPLPRHKKTLYRLLRAITKDEQAAVDAVLDEFWTGSDDGWVNGRANEEITKAATQAETNRRIAEEREAKRKKDDNGTNRSTNRATNRDAVRSTNAEPNHSHSQTPDTKARHQSQTQTPDPPDGPSQASDSGGSVERPDLGATPPVALAPRRRGNGADPPSVVAGIFDCWRDTLGHPRARLDDKRRKVIGRALKLGYTAAELCEAIHGCAVTPHNMGVNDRGARYDTLGLILRDADHIDRFIRNAKEPPQPRNDAEARFLHNVANAESAMRVLAERDQREQTDDRH